MGLPEVIVICIDTSTWMNPRGLKYKAQLDAIKIYCQAKFEAHSETVVSLFTMGSLSYCFILHPPTRSLEEIVSRFSFINSGAGPLDLLLGLSAGRLPLVPWLDCPHKKKLRMLFLVGGFTNLSSRYAEQFGKEYKDMGIAVDVINFYLGKTPIHSMSEYHYGRTELDAFVNACNHNDNSHIVHVERSFCISDVVFTSILKNTLHLSRKENVNVKGDMELSGKNQATEARGIEYVTHSKRKLKLKNQAAEARGIEYGHATLS